jgi:DNA repair protein RAD5
MFFAGSDDESSEGQSQQRISEPPGLPTPTKQALPVDDAIHPPSEPATPTTRSSPPLPLFFADSDEEELELSSKPFVANDAEAIVVDEDEDIRLTADVTAQAVPRSPVQSHNKLASSPTHSLEPPNKKRRLSPAPVPQQPPSNSNEPVPPKVSSSHFVGTFIIPNAWSTVRGKGYISPGDPVIISREEIEDNRPKAQTKGVASGTKGKKQLNIATMMKRQTKPPPNKKRDIIVRLINVRGFGTFVGFDLML